MAISQSRNFTISERSVLNAPVTFSVAIGCGSTLNVFFEFFEKSSKELRIKSINCSFSAVEIAASFFLEVEIGRIIRELNFTATLTRVFLLYLWRWMPDLSSGNRKPNSGGRFEQMPWGVTEPLFSPSVSWGGVLSARCGDLLLYPDKFRFFFFSGGWPFKSDFFETWPKAFSAKRFWTKVKKAF